MRSGPGSPHGQGQFGEQDLRRHKQHGHFTANCREMTNPIEMLFGGVD